MSTRRDFLGTSLTLAAATQLAPHALGNQAAPAKKLRYALVGLGRLSTNQIAPALLKTAKSELAGIVSGSATKPAEWKTKYKLEDKNIYNYRNFDEIANNPDIDVVYVVLPNSMHEEFTIRAARAGKHVLCEKPMSVSSQECRNMIKVCKDANVKLAVGYRCQFEPHHLECIRTAREGRMGKIHQIDAGFGFRMANYKVGDLYRWRIEREYAGGGALMDVGIYALQACRVLTGEEPVSVMARELKTDPVKFAEVDETILWSMDFPGGSVGNCTTTYNYNGVNHFTAYAERGKFGLEPAFGYSGIQGKLNNTAMSIPEIDQFAAEIDDFSTCIAENKQSKVSGEEGLRDLLVVEAIYESVRTGKRVDVAKV